MIYGFIYAKKAALYVRVSTDKQDELSPDAQIRLGREYCEKNGLRLFMIMSTRNTASPAGRRTNGPSF